MLDEAADFVNREGGSCGEASRTSRLKLRDEMRRADAPDSSLRARGELDVPDGAENVIVELPTAHGEPDRETVTLTTARKASSGFTNGISDPFPHR